jgi:hypothetical protein
LGCLSATYETASHAPEDDGDWHGKYVSYSVAEVQQNNKIAGKAQHQRQDVDQVAPNKLEGFLMVGQVHHFGS